MLHPSFTVRHAHRFVYVDTNHLIGNQLAHQTISQRTSIAHTYRRSHNRVYDRKV